MSKNLKKLLSCILSLCVMVGGAGIVSAADPTLRIEGEAYQGDNKDLVTLDHSRGVLDVNVVDAAGVDFSRYLFEYGICVEKTGYYDVKVVSEAVTLPTVKLLINDVEQDMVIDGANGTAKCKLNAGENVIAIKVYRGVWNGEKDVVSFILDCIELTYSDTQSITVQKEGEAYDSTTITGNTFFSQNTWENKVNVSGGNGALSEATTAGEFVYTVTVPEAGMYQFTASNQSLSAINTYTLKINGTDYNVDSSTAVQESFTPQSYALDGVELLKTTLTSNVPLMAGTNTVKIIPSRRDAVGDYWLRLDYMSFEYKGKLSVAPETTEIQIENCTNFDGKGFVTCAASGASGSTFVGIDGNNTVESPIIIESKINVAVGGMYKLGILCGTLGDNSDYDSKMSFNVNDEMSGETLKWTVLDDNDGLDTGKIFDDNSWGAGSHRFGLKIYEFPYYQKLVAGENTVKIAIEKRIYQGDYLAAFDSFKLTQISDLENVELSIDKNFLNATSNETASADVLATDLIGANVTAESIITYSSSNENIATIDNTGVITAHNPGNTLIEASVTYTGENQVTKKVSKMITVYGSEGVVVLGAERTGNNIKVRLSNLNESKTSALTIYVALYEQENGEITSLKEVKQILNEGYIATLVQEENTTLESTIGENDPIKVFCWSEQEFMTPCFSVTEVQ